jgi:hypothetical protein
VGEVANGGSEQENGVDATLNRTIRIILLIADR